MTLRRFTRSFRSARGLAIAIITMMALGVGALVTTFSLVDAALIRQPPFHGADRLVILYQSRSRPGGGTPRAGWSYPRIQLLRTLSRDFLSLANYSPTTGQTLVGPNDAEPVRGEYASPSYFSVLGVGAALGRIFAESEDVASASSPVVLVSYDLWHRRFGGDSGLIGRQIRINGTQLTVIGVMPRNFRGLSDRAQLWMPTALAPRLTYPQYLVSDQAFITVIARLGPHQTVADASAQLKVLAAQIDHAMPARAGIQGVVSGTAAPLGEARVDPVTRRSLLLLFAAVALLYALACANVTSLLLGRTVARRREAAVRAALGGLPARVFREFLEEGFTIILAGGTLGILLAAWAGAAMGSPTDLWRARSFAGGLASFADPAFGARDVAFGAVVVVLGALIVSWGPALSTVRGAILDRLREGVGASTGSTGSLRRPSKRGVIVALETALAMILVVAGGLMIDSFRRMRGTDLGVDAERVLTFWVLPPEARYPTSEAPRFISRVLAAITSVPGVVSASVEGGAPGIGTARGLLHIVGRPESLQDLPTVLRHYVGPDHFRTLGIPLLRGRTFTDADGPGRPRVAIVSQSAARRFWPGVDPIGQRVWFGPGSGFPSADSSAEIIGIAADVRYEPLDRAGIPYSVYTPYAQFTYSSRLVLVRAAGDPLAILPDVRTAIHRIEPELAVNDVATLPRLIAGSWARHRFDALLFGGFATLALVLAAGGIFAVVLHAASHRSREMGIRLALGSSPMRIVRLMVREGMVFPLLGLLVGIAASLAATRVLPASLYEITPTDPVVFLGTILLLLVVSVVACLLPARRVARVDPLEALRAE